MMNFQTFSTTDAYNTFRLSVLLKVEESGIPKTLPYLDGKQIPTMGIGFNLRVKFNRDKILTEMGFNVNATGKEKEYLDLIEAAVDLAYSSGSAGLDALKTNLDAVMSLWAADTSVISHNGKPKRSIFTLDTAEINTVFDSIAPDYEKLVNAWAAKYGFVVTDSRERAVLLSLAWNSQDKNKDGIPDLLGDGLGRAIAQDNRAEAWFEIRYGSNGDKLAGIAKRRYYEAETFGLYKDSANITVDEAKQVYCMFTLHRAKIADYELKYGVGFDGSVTTANYINGMSPLYAANRDYGLSSANGVKAINVQLNPARDLLIFDLATNANPDIVNAYQAWTYAGNIPANFLSTNLYLDPGRKMPAVGQPLGAIDPNHAALLDARQYRNGAEIASNDILIGEGGASGLGGDMLVGGMGDDLIIGGSGDDVLYGGAGDDVMAGGAGNDTYILNSGGKDTLEDKQGFDRILFNGKALYSFIRQADGSLKSPDGFFTAAWIGTDLVVTDVATNDTATLNRNFQSGDFGIILSDAPTAPVTARTIPGDIIPTDINSSTAGIQAQRDAQGNLIGTAGLYEDILVGTVADEHILSGALNDDIGGRAGNDWIEGSSGSDYINGDEGLDLIEGGAGADILAGDAGDDRIFGNTKMETATAITNGNADTPTGLKGDWLAGNAGDDTLVAGAENDVLTGGAGRDLLIAGAGDDYIAGDADYTPQAITEATPRYSVGSINWYHTSSVPFNWTVTPQAGIYLFQPADGLTDPPDSGADVVYAGAGADHVWAGAGSDIVFGEGGDAANDSGWRAAA